MAKRKEMKEEHLVGGMRGGMGARDEDSDDSDSGEVKAKTMSHSIDPAGVDQTDGRIQDTDMLDVEFEWFDPQPEIDFHGLKTLLRQLFDVDNQLFDLSALTDLILEQPLLGSTVKVDGNETDPYAFLTVLNLHEHRVRLPVCSTEVHAG